MSGSGNGIEIDHVQYGLAEATVPIPASLVLLGSGLAALFGFIGRRPFSRNKGAL